MPKSNWNKSFDESFLHASEGLNDALKSEKNLKIEIIISIFVLILGIVFKISNIELILLIFSIGLVMITELVNTGIEATVDISAKFYDKNAKYAKDLAAGAVIFSTSFAGICGYLIFADKIYNTFLYLVKIGKYNILLCLGIVLLLLINTYVLVSFLKKKNGISIMGTIFALILFASTYFKNNNLAIIAIIVLLTSILFQKKNNYMIYEKGKRVINNYIIRMYSGILIANIVVLVFLGLKIFSIV